MIPALLTCAASFALCLAASAYLARRGHAGGGGGIATLCGLGVALILLADMQAALGSFGLRVLAGIGLMAAALAGWLAGARLGHGLNARPEDEE